MIEKKIYNMLSLCQRANKLVSGSFMCEKNIKKGKGIILIVAKDASDNTKREFNNICKNNNVTYLEFGNKEQLGKYIGKESRVVVCICDENFAKSIYDLIEK